MITLSPNHLIEDHIGKRLIITTENVDKIIKILEPIFSNFHFDHYRTNDKNVNTDFYKAIVTTKQSDASAGRRTTGKHAFTITDGSSSYSIFFKDTIIFKDSEISFEMYNFQMHKVTTAKPRFVFRSEKR